MLSARRLSTRTSASAVRRSSAPRSSGLRRSSAAARLRWLTAVYEAEYTRYGSPPAGSTLTTSAPKSASSVPANGAATNVLMSSTRIPVSGRRVGAGGGGGGGPPPGAPSRPPASPQRRRGNHVLRGRQMAHAPWIRGQPDGNAGHDHPSQARVVRLQPRAEEGYRLAGQPFLPRRDRCGRDPGVGQQV